MRILAIIALAYMVVSCSERKVLKGMVVKYQVWYTAGTWELIDASPYVKLERSGCMVDGGKVLACSVRRIIPLPKKEY
jgi:hypothetical protein